MGVGWEAGSTEEGGEGGRDDFNSYTCMYM